MMKALKTCAALLLLCALITLPALAAEARISASNERAEAGGRVRVTVALEDNPGVTSVKLKVGYDADILELESLAITDTFKNAGGVTALETADTNPLVLFWVRPLGGNVSESGAFATAVFRIKSGAAAGTYPISLSYDENDVYDETETNVPFAIANGSVTVLPASSESGSGASSGDSGSGSGDPGSDRGAPPESTTTNSGDGTPAAQRFSDVPAGSYYAEAVAWAVEKGVTSGTGADTFSPDLTCTRAQTVTFLWRAAGAPEPITGESPFADVKPGAYYYKAALWAVETGVTNGTAAGLFDPHAQVSRAQAVTFLYRAQKVKPETGKSTFSDVPANAYYAPAAAWAAGTGVAQGVSAGQFAPDRPCSRAQIVTFMYRALT